MSDPATQSVLIIGVGNRDRGDDGAGPVVADRLRAKGVAAIDVAGDCTRLLDVWQDRQRVIVIDAMRSGAPVGTVRTFDAIREPLPKDAFNVSTHLFGLAAAIELARPLDRLPPNLTVYGIESRNFAVGAPMSEPVVDALSEVQCRILRLLRPAV